MCMMCDKGLAAIQKGKVATLHIPLNPIRYLLNNNTIQ